MAHPNPVGFWLDRLACDSRSHGCWPLHLYTFLGSATAVCLRAGDRRYQLRHRCSGNPVCDHTDRKRRDTCNLLTVHLRPKTCMLDESLHDQQGVFRRCPSHGCFLFTTRKSCLLVDVIFPPFVENNLKSLRWPRFSGILDPSCVIFARLTIVGEQIARPGQTHRSMGSACRPSSADCKIHRWPGRGCSSGGFHCPRDSETTTRRSDGVVSESHASSSAAMAAKSLAQKSEGKQTHRCGVV